MKIVTDEKNGYSEVHVMHIPQAFTYTMNHIHRTNQKQHGIVLQGGSNMTGTDLCVNKPHMSRSYLNHLVHPHM